MKVEGIFKCTSNQQDNIPKELVDKIGLEYEEINNNSDHILELASLLSKDEDSKVIKLPFCHTMEIEAFGSKIKYDCEYGNRVENYFIEDIGDLEKLKVLDIEKGRINQIFDAINKIKEKDMLVVLNITGPYTIATGLMSDKLFFKLYRTDRGKLLEVLKIIEESLIILIKEAVRLNVDIISFADPSGTIDIIGPKVYKDMIANSILNILSSVNDHLGNSVIHLCGKTSSSLSKIGKLELEYVDNDKEFYIDKVLELGLEGVNFIGNWCLKLEINPKKICICRLKTDK